MISEFKDVIDINLGSVFYLTKASIKFFFKTKRRNQ